HRRTGHERGGSPMTWLTIDGGPTSSELEDVLALQPDGARALRGLLAATRASVDADLLGPVAVRLAQVLDVPAGLLVDLIGLSPGAVAESTAALQGWPSGTALDDRQRSAVAHAEQFAIDVTGIAD